MRKGSSNSKRFLDFYTLVAKAIHPISFAARVQKSRKAKELLKNCLSFYHIAAIYSSSVTAVYTWLTCPIQNILLPKQNLRQALLLRKCPQKGQKMQNLENLSI
jgi:hypothetical protein